MGSHGCSGFSVADRLPPLVDVRVELLADVPDIRPWFGDANIMVAPIRAGSGTRLKILEAFAAEARACVYD